MSEKLKPYPKNVEGDFYVEDGCCITCMTPEFYAPNLMGFDEEVAHCFVTKQPTTENEVYQLIKATWAAEVGCIRYGGQNSQILRRLAEAGVPESCDQQYLVEEIKPLLRNHVIFAYAQMQYELELAEQFKEYLLHQNTEHLHYKITKIVEDKSGIAFSFSWFEENYYSIWFTRIASLNAWHIFHSPDFEAVGSKGVSLQIDEWLRGNENVFNIKWYSNKAWNNYLLEWQETPI